MADLNVFTDVQLYTWLHPDMVKKPTVLTITDTTAEQVRRPKPPYDVTLLALHFKETNYPLLIGKPTNRNILVNSLGGQTGKWIGAKITVTTEGKQIGRKMVKTLTITKVEKANAS